MSVANYFPVWDKLAEEQQQRIVSVSDYIKAKQGTLLHSNSEECLGLLMIRSGQLRAYILSEDGREITLYRLLDQDICLFSASCVMRSVQFEIMIAAEKESEVFILPPYIFKRIMDESAPLANYINELMATRFSEVM